MGLLHIHMAGISFSLTMWQLCTLLHERISWPPSGNFDVKSKIRLCQLCIFTSRTLVPNFIPTLETMEP